MGASGSGTLKNMQGRKIGKLLVLARAGLRSRQALWLCRCDCGTVCSYTGVQLRKAERLSCGCRQRARSNLVEVLTSTTLDDALLSMVGSPNRILLVNDAIRSSLLAHALAVRTGRRHRTVRLSRKGAARAYSLMAPELIHEAP